MKAQDPKEWEKVKKLMDDFSLWMNDHSAIGISDISEDTETPSICQYCDSLPCRCDEYNDRVDEEAIGNIYENPELVDKIEVL